MTPLESAYMKKLTEVLVTLRQAGTHICLGAKPGEDAVAIARPGWCKVLMSQIPLAQLESAIMDAFYEKCGSDKPSSVSSVRSLSAGEVLRHWKAAKAETAEQNRLERLLKPKRCEYCKGSLRITVYDPKIKSNVEKDCPFHGVKK